MMEVSLNEINRSIGKLIGTVEAVEKKVDEQSRKMETSERTASENRANIHRRLDDIVERTGDMESEFNTIKRDVSSIRRKVDEHEQVTIQIKHLRSKAEGAGTLGRWLIKFGGWILGGASTIGMIYTWLTGRPPP